MLQHCRKLKKNEEHQLLNELEFSDAVASSSAPPKSIRDENLTMSDLFARYNGECCKSCSFTEFAVLKISFF